MSHKMNNQQDAEQQLSALYQESSDEVTSEQADAIIMAMAQREAEASEPSSGHQSWWHRLRMPVSVAAALVVTVGIARFMVELGYYDPTTTAQSNAQASDYSTRVVLEDDNFNVVRAAPSANVQQAKESIDAEGESFVAEEQMAKIQSIQVMSARLKTEQQEMTRQRLQQEQQLAASTKASNEEQEQAVYRAKRVEKNDKNHMYSEVSDVATGSRQAVEAPYLSAKEWLQSIEQLLNNNELKRAKKQWIKFQQVYPDYVVAKGLVERLEQL